MMTIGLILLGAVLGAVTTFVVCSRGYAASLYSTAADVQRRAYALGYEEGAKCKARGPRLKAQGVVQNRECGLLVTDVKPDTLVLLAQRWVREGRRLNCHAWLAALPLGAAMTDDEAWCTVPFWARLCVFIVVVFAVALWGAVLLIKDRDPGADEDVSRREEFFRNVNANMHRPDGGEGRRP